MEQVRETALPLNMEWETDSLFDRVLAEDPDRAHEAVRVQQLPGGQSGRGT